MDARDVYNLYEAYRSVYEDRESLYEDVDYDLDEAKGEGPEAAMPGTQLFQQLFRGNKKRKGSKEAPMDVSRFQGRGSKAKRRMNNEEVDLYDVVLDHLLDEGYCDDVQSAEIIMANMSEEWLDGICERFKPTGYNDGVSQKATHIRSQIARLKGKGKHFQASEVEHHNKEADTYEGRGGSVAISTANKERGRNRRA